MDENDFEAEEIEEVINEELVGQIPPITRTQTKIILSQLKEHI